MRVTTEGGDSGVVGFEPKWLAPPPARTKTRDVSRIRLWLVILAFVGLYGVIAGRLIMLGFIEPAVANNRQGAEAAIAAARPDIVDRNGDILATDIRTASLYAEPRRILDVDEAAEGIHSVLPELSIEWLRDRLDGNEGFIWLKREITPRQQDAIHRLGIPGIGFLAENQRFYPGGPVASHILGSVNVDNQGIAGMEKYIDDTGLRDLQEFGFAAGTGADLEAVQLSIDLRVQYILRDELAQAVDRYSADAAAGVILNIHTGEVMAMSSLPDYDPNQPAQALDPDRLNRITSGVFELGSVFKSLTIAMALDSGLVHLGDMFDASQPLHAGGFTINDFHGQHRPLSVAEVFTYSSNIGAARMALTVGTDGQQEFLARLGITSRVQTELPETAAPARAGPVDRSDDDDRFLRPRPVDDADEPRGCRGGPDEWRLSHPADLPDPHAAGGERRGGAGDQPGDEPGDALPLPSQCGGGDWSERRRSRLFRRRQDRHGGKDRRRPIFLDAGLQLLPCRVPDGRSAICGARHRRQSRTLCRARARPPPTMQRASSAMSSAGRRRCSEWRPGSIRSIMPHLSHIDWTEMVREGPDGDATHSLMQLDELVRDLPVEVPAGALDITGLTADSRAVKPGFLFAALRGVTADGARFAGTAVAAGAAAILADDEAELGDIAVPVIRAHDPRRVLSLMAARFFPHQPEQLVAVTGTSGKTSVAVFVRQIFEHAGKTAASIGTIGVVGPKGWQPGSLTTPDPVALHQMLDRLVIEDGVTHAAMEASSHGLDQRRLDGLRLTAAGFTNLGRDHMDYHADVAAYLGAKLRLFRDILPTTGTAVVNADSDVAVEVIAAVKERGAATHAGWPGRRRFAHRCRDAGRPRPAACARSGRSKHGGRPCRSRARFKPTMR